MMKKLKAALSSPITTIVLFVAAAVLLLTGGIGGARAALKYFSQDYKSEIELSNIGVALWEESEKENVAVATEPDVVGPLLANLLPEGKDVEPGRVYKEKLTVQNTGGLDEYVRVTIYKYWVDENGVKQTDLMPEWIGLEWDLDNGDWILDESASTRERTVLYYTKILPIGKFTSPLTKTFTIDESVMTNVTQTERKENGYTIITTTYEYDGMIFRLEAEVDAVQGHNAEPAIHSVWGTNMELVDGVLRFKEGQ